MRKDLHEFTQSGIGVSGNGLGVERANVLEGGPLIKRPMTRTTQFIEETRAQSNPQCAHLTLERRDILGKQAEAVRRDIRVGAKAERNRITAVRALATRKLLVTGAH